MIEIKIDQSENENYLKVNGNRATFSIEMYYLFEAFAQSAVKDMFNSAFLAYLSSNEELLNAFKEHVDDPKFIHSIDELIRCNKELFK